MKFSKATYVIALATVVLIGITAWVTMRTERQEKKEERFDQDIIMAIQSGDAVQLSALFTEGISFYTPEEGSSGNWREAAHNLKSFFHKHPVKGFTEEWIRPGEQADVSYLKGTLFTQDKDYDLYATIYTDQIEQLDISSLKNDRGRE
jgi:hypothetical protein